MNARLFNFLKMFEDDPEKFYVEEMDFKRLGLAIGKAKLDKKQKEDIILESDTLKKGE